MEESGLTMPNTHRMSSLPSCTSSSPSRTQPTAFYYPDHARSLVVGGSLNSFQIQAAGRRKKAYETSMVYRKWASYKIWTGRSRKWVLEKGGTKAGDW
jgi:hypothetical protein